MTTTEAARHIRRSPRTLKKWRSKKKGPPFVRFDGDREVRYSRQRLDEWMSAQEIDPTDEPFRPSVVRTQRASR